MKNVILLFIFIFSIATSLQAQEQPEVRSAQEKRLAKAKKEVDSQNGGKGLWPLISGQRQSQDRAQKKKARQILRKMKEEEIQSEKAALANGTSQERFLADKMYQNLGYAVSADEYIRLNAEEKADQLVIANMANSYRLNNQTMEAEYWYGRIINYTNDAENMLHYAQMLQINGKCEDASRWYKAYARKTNLKLKRNREVIEDCNELNQIITHRNIKLHNLAALNTGHLDFSPIPFKNGVVFTSTRGEDEESINRDNWTNENFTDLYYAEQIREGVFKNPVPLTGDINAKFHDGVATFSAGDRIMIFTRNNYNGISSDGLIDLKIYESVQSNDQWVEAEELPINSDEFTSCHPTISTNGQRLYFASNRPGGYGGLDIYVSINEGGTWSVPINLGPEVNSEGNELFPFIGEDETLYYSSNGWRGLGGLDLFKVVKANKENESTWGRRENMGRPFNSQKDDFGFHINREKDKGYISSNREGGNGGDDIYSWNMEGGQLESPTSLARQLCVRDEQVGFGLANTTVFIDPISTMEEKDADGDLHLMLKPVDDSKEEYLLSIRKSKKNSVQSVAGGSYITDGQGLLNYQVRSDNHYRIKVIQDGYETKELTISGEEWINQNEFCIRMNKVYQPTPTSEYNNPPIPVDDHYIPVVENKEIPVHVDHHYIPVSEDSDEPKRVDHHYIPVSEDSDVVQDLNYVSINPQSVAALREHFLGDVETEFVEGQVFELKNIYYDFDKATIRSEATMELDRVVNLLLTYPNMEIELGTHTDSRGSLAYNTDLSKRRAEAVVRYIMERGIEPHRLTSVGYGEYKLINQCADNVDCKEEEHQANRRTEITIRKLETSDKTISK